MVYYSALLIHNACSSGMLIIKPTNLVRILPTGNAPAPLHSLWLHLYVQVAYDCLFHLWLGMGSQKVSIFRSTSRCSLCVAAAAGGVCRVVAVGPSTTVTVISIGLSDVTPCRRSRRTLKNSARQYSQIETNLPTSGSRCSRKRNASLSYSRQAPLRSHDSCCTRHVESMEAP